MLPAPRDNAAPIAIADVVFNTVLRIIEDILIPFSTKQITHHASIAYETNIRIG